MADSEQGALVLGSLAGQPGAPELVRSVRALLDRYVHEVVMAWSLCPFLRSADAGLGRVVVVLDDALDEELLELSIAETPTGVTHVVYPLLSGSASPFERFASRVGTRLQARLGRASPVSATFHPRMVGARDDPHRLIGLLRRAPDPFVQYIPPGLTEGGTVVAGAPLPPEPGAEATFRRLTGDGGAIEAVLARIAELHEAHDIERTALLARYPHLAPRALDQRDLRPRAPG